MTAKRVLVTGATGFVGRRLIHLLVEKGYLVRALVRDRHGMQQACNIEFVEVPDLTLQEDWNEIVQDCYAVVHLAARVHMMHDNAPDSMEAYTRVNTTVTSKISIAAADAGVKRFIFLSSIKSCDVDEHEEYFHVDDHYAFSKAMAEKKLVEICENSDMEYVIIRPPLVYGPGVKANFKKLIEIVEKGVPLPFALIKNKRSFIGLGNLTAFILHVLKHPAASNRAYNISDDEDLSTPALIRKIAAKLGRNVTLFPLPENFLRFLCMIAGQGKACERLTGSLRVDWSGAKKELGWYPAKDFDQELEETIRYYLKSKQAND